ncbi:MAG TPA: phosphotransferase [Anaerolineae bacterium]|nr:phosphotransferase [Anaerolineae bacterium]
MKPYADLSMAGKRRRLHRIAVDALARYDLREPVLAYHGFATNLLYRVTTGSGERFILRLAPPGWRTLEDLQSDALWLSALARDTAIPVPRVVPSASGELVVPLARPDVAKTWNATLMSWLPGRLLGHYLTERNLEKMGALFAELHHHGGAWTPPAGFTTRRFDHWLSRGEPNLIARGVPAGDAAVLPAGQQDLLVRIQEHVERAYAQIDRSDLRVIHCDLWHDNIKLHRGVLYPFDFEDTVWGFRAHDIAMAMLDLLEATDEVQYPRLLTVFRRGYEAFMEWPADPLEQFQAGRLLWRINWVARFRPKGFLSMVARHMPVLGNYERTGRIGRPPLD